MYYIGEFSKLGKTTIKTLHYYDRIGLLKPQETDNSTGYRLYTTRQLLDLHRIQSLRQSGLSVDEVQQIFAGSPPRPILERRHDEIIQELRKQEEQSHRIAFILSNEEKESFMDYQATIKDLPGHIVFSKRLTVPDFDAYFKVIPSIGEAIGAANPNLKCTTPGYCYIVYLDGEYKEHDISIEYNEAVVEKGNEVDGIIFKEVDPVTVVSVMHRGAYADLPKAYAYVLDWVEQNGYRIVESARESYIDGVWNTRDQSDWLTEIQIPISA